MSSIAILDFDGVIADMTEHVRTAQERARTFTREQGFDPEDMAYSKMLSTFFYSERGFFDTGLVASDRLMPGCEQALAQLLRHYDKVVVVTSRPFSMREATLRWFSQWCPGYESVEFIFKDSGESVVKTTAWKAEIVARFARQYETILFIDDDKRNRKAVEALAADLDTVTLSIQSCFEECFPGADLS